MRNSRTSGSGLHGGGIWVANGATLNMSRSAVYGNTATQNGGGIAVAGGGTVTITNSTIYGNTAGAGGGIYIGTGSVQNTPTATLRHVTITGNKRTGSSNRGGLRLNFGNVHMQNSIIYGNQGINCDSVNNSDGNFVTLSGNIIGGTGNASKCTLNQDLTSNPQLSSSPTGSPPYYTIPSNSPAVNAATCISGITVDQRGASRPQPAGNSNCDIGAYEYHPPTQNSPVSARASAPGAVSSGSSPARDEDMEDTGYSPPPPSSCSTLDGIIASNINVSTQCQRVNAMQIANPAIKDSDFVDAVDVWGWVTPNSEICFEAAGSAIKFIDTVAMPRTTTDLIAFRRQNNVCASIDGPGILVLLPGQPPAQPASSQSGARRLLNNCMVTLTEKLNFRETPGGEIMEVLSKDFKLTAEERTDAWFKVDFWGKKGWVSADYVVTEGSCG